MAKGSLMESHIVKPGLYRVKACGESYRVRKNVGGWWEIHAFAFGEWHPYCDYNKFNTKKDAMKALKTRHSYWEKSNDRTHPRIH